MVSKKRLPKLITNLLPLGKVTLVLVAAEGFVVGTGEVTGDEPGAGDVELVGVGLVSGDVVGVGVGLTVGVPDG